MSHMFYMYFLAGAQPAELILRERFKELDCSMEFSALKYVGTKTSRDHATDFTRLLKVVQDQLNNNSIRAPRKPGIIFKTLQVRFYSTVKPVLGSKQPINQACIHFRKRQIH